MDPSQNGLDASFPTKSRQEICSADLKRARWGKMLNEPIKPPRIYAGLDMAKSDNWEGLTIEDAEKAPDPVTLEGGNCQSVPEGFYLGDTGTDGQNHWGDNAEVQFAYHVDTHIVDQMLINLGYLGTWEFTGSHGMDKNSGLSWPDATKNYHYIWQIGQTWQKCVWDGQACVSGTRTAFQINWGDADGMQTNLTELYNAAMWENGPDAGITHDLFTMSPGCVDDGGCLAINDDGLGNSYFGVRPLAVYTLTHVRQPPPIPSQPYLMYNFYVKNEPYSSLPLALKIDGEGARASANLGGTAPAPCTITADGKLTYGDFLANCVQVSKDPAVNKLNLNKLLGGITHDYENWTFNVVGVNGNFTSLKIAEDPKHALDVLTDQDLPDKADPNTDFIFDVRAKATPDNEKNASTGKSDRHGTGLLWREWQRLLLSESARAMDGLSAAPAANGKYPAKHVPGDPACYVADPTVKPPADCTGLENLILPGISYPGDTPEIKTLLAGGTSAFGTVGSKGYLVPGDPATIIFWDPGTFGYYMYGKAWANALAFVTRYMGRGNVLALPAEMRDRRFYYKWYTVALIKYLKAYGNKVAAGQDPNTLTPTDVANTSIDYDSLFFDNAQGGFFDSAEYIERAYIKSKTDIPWDFQYGADTKVANQRYTNWYHRMDREEDAMYEAMLTDKSHAPGQENNVTLTNLAGSVLLAAHWENYDCATVGGATCSDPSSGNPASPPPQRVNPDTGAVEPLLAPYPGAWGHTVFSVGTDSPIRIVSTNPQLQAAHVQIPNLTNPYDTSQKNPPMLDVLVPWVDAIIGNGFNLPIDGQRDKNVTTQTLDFTGVLENYDLDFEYTTDPVHPTCSANDPCQNGARCNTQETGGIGQCVKDTIHVDAIEAPDFLGEVFVCQDPEFGDILHVGMYTSAHVIVDWLAAHPQAQDSCDMILRYSSYNNYLDYVTSRANGVKLSINPGQGQGRVTDALVFDPAFASQ